MKNHYVEFKNFHLEYKTVDKYQAAVFSKNYLRLDMYLKEVKCNLKDFGFIGNIIFDLVLTNGLNNRFFEMFFDGEDFDIKSLKSIKDVSCNVLKASHNYYKKHVECLDNAAMTSKQKELFISELI